MDNLYYMAEGNWSQVTKSTRQISTDTFDYDSEMSFLFPSFHDATPDCRGFLSQYYKKIRTISNEIEFYYCSQNELKIQSLVIYN